MDELKVSVQNELSLTDYVEDTKGIVCNHAWKVLTNFELRMKEWVMEILSKHEYDVFDISKRSLMLRTP
jgi:hypothetical protein